MRTLLVFAAFLWVAGCADRPKNTFVYNPTIESVAIDKWVNECRTGDVSDVEKQKPERAAQPLERRLISLSSELDSERNDLESRLSRNEQIVQMVNFATFLISMLAACFVAVNANHFQAPRTDPDVGRGGAPRCS